MNDLEMIIAKHQISLNNITRTLGDVATALERHDSEVKFLGEQLVDIHKKVNEGLMIANEYERKQKTLNREIREFLDNIAKGNE